MVPSKQTLDKNTGGPKNCSAASIIDNENGLGRRLDTKPRMEIAPDQTRGSETRALQSHGEEREGVRVEVQNRWVDQSENRPPNLDLRLSPH